VIDDAKTRRGRPTAAAELGNPAAILSGDVLLAKAMTILAEDGDLQVIRVVSQAVHDMAEGEVTELAARGHFDLAEDEYYRIIESKTGRFIEACCEVGAIIADASEEQTEALRHFGVAVGIAFQIVDDLLDYRGDRSKTGKATGTDFRDGQMTLPMIYLRGTLSEGEEKIARARFGNGASDDEIRMIADWMDTRGAFAGSEAEADLRISKAREALNVLPESRSRQVLQAVADYVLLRKG
jgi:octaprenyl-diphosphate synthase